VKWSELDQSLQTSHERIVDLRGLAQFAAVDDPVGNGVRRDEIVDGSGIVAVYEVELEARRAGVDDEDRQPGQAQSRISGGSSPCMRPYARAR